MGKIYLLHFDKPIGNKQSDEVRASRGLPERRKSMYKPTLQHYIGWTSKNNVDDRLLEHRTGRGARITQVACERGIEFTVVRTWSGSRKQERLLKNQKNTRRMCPVCTPKTKRGRLKRRKR